MFDLESLSGVEPDADEAALIARIAALEQVKCAAAAGQARAAAELDASRRAAESATGVPAQKQGRGVASEVALARRDSPSRGGRHLGFAKALVYEMPHTLAALECGALSEWRATLVVRESACLDVEDRRTLDAELCGDRSALDGMGDARVAAAAREIAYRLDAQAVVDRASHAETERTVTIRPAPDTMTWLTALLPVAQGVSVYAALRRTADTCADGRSRGQVMADTLVERVTGRPADVPVPIAVNLVVSDEAMFAGSTEPALIDGYGPIPAAVARRLADAAVGDKRSKATLRRLYRRPTTGALVAMESRSRCFPRGLADFIGLRDQRCRTPYCDAPIRHRDHAQPHHRDGPTSASNGLGACERCNYTKESPGWEVSARTDETGCHTAEFVTPTGACYQHRSTADQDATGCDQRNRSQDRHQHRAPTRRLTRRWWGRRRRLPPGEVPVVRILRRIHHGEKLTHGRPVVDVDGHALIDDVLIDGRTVDDAGDGDELLAGGVGPRADTGDQQCALREFTAQPTPSHDKRCRQ